MKRSHEDGWTEVTRSPAQRTPASQSQLRNWQLVARGGAAPTNGRQRRGAGLAASHAGARRGREMVTSLGGAITVRALSTPAFSELPQVLGRDLQLAVTRALATSPP